MSGRSKVSISSSSDVVRIKPNHYIHVHDNNTGTTKVLAGPATFTRQDHEKVVSGPTQMTIIPPRCYCRISNPVKRDADGNPKTDKNGNYELAHGDSEIRFEQPPFPLFPGEALDGKVEALTIVQPESALRLRASRDFTEGETSRIAGDEWLFKGPGTYIPRVEADVISMFHATVIDQDQAIKLRARRECVDSNGVKRRAGECWLVRQSGSYLPNVDEEVVTVVDAVILTDKKALHLRADKTYTDCLGKKRKAGEEWLITNSQCETYIADVNETVVGEVPITALNSHQYCVLLNPVGDNGRPQLGKKELICGPKTFFLRPGERLERGIQDVYVLSAEEALLLRAKEEYKEGEVVHAPGDRWMTYGPCSYVPPVEVEIIEKRSYIPLDENEGIYVRDINTGKVRAEKGKSYLLLPNEELWSKDLPATVEALLAKNAGGKSGARDKTRVVTLRVPHNACVQIYDYKVQVSRVQFGPNLVSLEPDEHFTVLSISGGKPKRPHVIKALSLLLGPDFMTDIVTVETSDHARLQLKLSYNWHFEIEEAMKKDPQAARKLFTVPDFVGDACKAIASRVRAAVAAEPFDTFHKNSAKIIRTAVFGVDENGKVNNTFKFNSNNLIITNIDIQSVEPVDGRTRDSLQKSVQLAIQITTESQEAHAKHEAERQEQEARGRLERQKIADEAESESAKRQLLTLQATCAQIESTGQATADARAKAEAAKIEGTSNVQLATLRAQSETQAADAELEQQKARQLAEIQHQEALDNLELTKKEALSKIEATKFKEIVEAIGADTISAIARAGPETKAKLLQGLGLKSLMITDGSSPVNLFNTANGLIGQNATE